MKKTWLLGILILAAMVSGGCQSKAPVEAPPVVITAVTEEATEATEAETEAGALQEGQAYSPLTGLAVESSLLLNRPVAVMIDNYVAARPQSALKEAEIIYEILAEGQITRYLAIYQANAPESIGPIRSSRMYYIAKALEYDPLYVHVGGSPEALTTLKTLDIGNVDGLVAGKEIFWRRNHKKAPNNMYSSITAIRKQAAQLKHDTTFSFESWKFKQAPLVIEGTSATQVKLVYKKPTDKDKVGYYTTYAYDETTMLYRRGFNGKDHKDELDGTGLTAMNVIVQVANHRVVDSMLRLEVDVVGKGSGLYLTMGKQIPITWEKPKNASLTRFYDEAGVELVLNPGVTWVQVIDSLKSVTIE
jgi:hypothetical protein